MLPTFLLFAVLSGAGARVVVLEQNRAASSELLASAGELLRLPALEWGMPLVTFKERSRQVESADALAPCRPDGEVCRLEVVREYVDLGPGELASLRELFARDDRQAWASVGALRLGPVAELIFDRSTARLIGVKMMQVRELLGLPDVRTEARLSPGTWTLSPRDPVEPATGERGVGTVRFVATPWANVSCGRWLSGQTPFAEARLPAGTYECEVSNPELGATHSVHLEVRANRRSVVRVRFE